MNTGRIKEIQKETAYPDSISVQQALMKVWNECQGEILKTPQVSVRGWVSVSDQLPIEHKHGMSLEVLTFSGSEMSVRHYDYELGRWTGSPHVDVKHWMELPSPPPLTQEYHKGFTFGESRT